MNTEALAGALLLAFFSSSPLFMHSAGLDSVRRFTDKPSRLPVLAAVMALSAVVSELFAYALLGVVMPRLGVSPSTLLAGAVIVFSVLAAAALLGAVRRYVRSLNAFLSVGEVFGAAYNSATVGILLLCRAFADGFAMSLLLCVLFSVSAALSYFVISVIREDLCVYRIPASFRGAPLLLILLGLAAMVFVGYAGAFIPEFEPMF